MGAFTGVSGFTGRAMSARSRASVYRGLSTDMASGATLTEALGLMAAGAPGRRRADGAVRGARAWLSKVAASEPLSASMTGWTSESDRTVIGAGEKAGDLPGGLANAAFMIEGMARIRANVVADALRLVPYALVLFAALAWIASR